MMITPSRRDETSDAGFLSALRRQQLARLPSTISFRVLLRERVAGGGGPGRARPRVRQRERDGSGSTYRATRWLTDSLWRSLALLADSPSSSPSISRQRDRHFTRNGTDRGDASGSCSPCTPSGRATTQGQRVAKRNGCMGRAEFTTELRAIGANEHCCVSLRSCCRQNPSKRRAKSDCISRRPSATTRM